MKVQIYQFVHAVSIILLTGFTLYVAANPQRGQKKKMMMVTGILALVALVGGSGLMAVLGYSWLSGWVIVKILAWLFLTALAGMAYRKSQSFVVTSVVIAVAVAVYMVYFKPF